MRPARNSYDDRVTKDAGAKAQPCTLASQTAPSSQMEIFFLLREGSVESDAAALFLGSCLQSLGPLVFVAVCEEVWHNMLSTAQVRTPSEGQTSSESMETPIMLEG